MEGGAVGHILKGTHPGTIPARLGLIWFRGEELNVKVYDVRRRTPSDGNSSPGLWPGELKKKKEKSTSIYFRNKAEMNISQFQFNYSNII